MIPFLIKFTDLLFVWTHIFLHFENEDYIGTSPAVDLEGTINVPVEPQLNLKIPSAVSLTNDCTF